MVRHPDLSVLLMNAFLRLLAGSILALALILGIFQFSFNTPNPGPDSVSIDLPHTRSRSANANWVSNMSNNFEDLAQTGPKTSESNPEADKSTEPLTDSSSNTSSDPAIEKAAQVRRSLRKEAERYDDETGNFVVLQPAAWIDLGDQSGLENEHSDGIQRIAEELRDKLDSADLDPSTPEYRRLWNQAVRESDWKFRARYGARAWSRHHIQAHHMAGASKN